MSFRIIRNDITKMNVEAIVNTANGQIDVGAGCDLSVYRAAGFDQLLEYRKQHIGQIEEGQSFLTPGFDLAAKYIIHTVSPFYWDGKHGEEEKLRNCYRNSLRIAKENDITEIAFPLISTGSFGYPKEEGMRIAIDEIHSFLLTNNMNITLVVFDDKATRLGEHLFSDLEKYISHNYVIEKAEEDYGNQDSGFIELNECVCAKPPKRKPIAPRHEVSKVSSMKDQSRCIPEAIEDWDFEGEHVSKINERINHRSDTFSQYLMFLIQEKGMENTEVYKRSIIDKKIFSKIKNNKDYHPQKMTALCLCIGATLNLDESKDLLARAGYALSPCDMTDIIFTYFIENKIYDMIELDIQLEEHGLPCIIA